MPQYDPRRQLEQRGSQRGKSLTELSMLVGRNPAYLRQYLRPGTPRRLPEDERRHLAKCLDIDERELGARDPWTPPLQ